MKAFDDGPRHFEQWSRDEDTAGVSTPTGGHLHFSIRARHINKRLGLEWWQVEKYGRKGMVANSTPMRSAKSVLQFGMVVIVR
ncbi:hypothetical protein TNCV_3843851 [Trichonephila clavipes]|nr:hypothetical protein TNCV_3843851 [Trichonephila clavipes]